MTRLARIKSATGIYHIMLRGANRQEIFHEDEDCLRFLETLELYKKKSEMRVHGWCLMGNHVHLLLQEGKEEISVTMKRIGVSFAWFYNKKYRTIGHLFQDRFKSETVEKDEYLIAVARYIHQNPVKAGMVKKPDDWKWSSCQGYYGRQTFPPALLDSDLLLDLFSNKREVAVNLFMEYNEAENNDKFIDNTKRTRLTDDEARSEINKAIIGYGITEIKGLPKAQRNEILAKVKEIEGIPQRQISRILGIPLSLICRAE